MPYSRCHRARHIDFLARHSYTSALCCLLVRTLTWARADEGEGEGEGADGYNRTTTTTIIWLGGAALRGALLSRIRQACHVKATAPNPVMAARKRVDCIMCCGVTGSFSLTEDRLTHRARIVTSRPSRTYAASKSPDTTSATDVDHPDAGPVELSHASRDMHTL